MKVKTFGAVQLRGSILFVARVRMTTTHQIFLPVRKATREEAIVAGKRWFEKNGIEGIKRLYAEKTGRAMI